MNPILNSDSYKYSQFNQYPEGTQSVFSYISSRGGKFSFTEFFGLQIFLQDFMTIQLTQAHIEEAEEIILAHGEPFNRAGFQRIVDVHNGYWPVSIRAIAEGSIVPTGNVLVTVENTDEECGWVTSFLETPLLRSVWYPTTVATNSMVSRDILKHYADMSSDSDNVDFKLHDFGMRGVSSYESGGIGGVAHLATGAMGTDTVTALLYAKKYYDTPAAAFSIPAMEHSTVTSWGRENEVASYRNMLDKYAKPGAIIAAVSDSYDIFNACELWGTVLKDQVIESGATLVVRPDSGDPASVVTKCLKTLDKYFGHTVNAKGYKVLNNVRVIQGDGINHDSIRHILFCAVDMAGYSLDNIAFGQGGALLQAVDRDTLKFAMKCSAIKVNGQWRDVFKDPITDPGKASLKGRIDLKKNAVGEFETVRIDGGWYDKSELWTVYENGKLYNRQTLTEIRERANSMPIPK